MTTFQAEEWETVRDEIIEYWPEHYAEAYDNDDYNPDFESYDATAMVGQLLVVTARREKQLAGYTVSFIRPHLHQKHVLWGMVDSYFLRPQSRAPRIFPRLLEATELEMKKLGVQRVFGTERSDGRMFAYMGYRAAERVYVKEI